MTASPFVFLRNNVTCFLFTEKTSATGATFASAGYLNLVQLAVATAVVSAFVHVAFDAVILLAFIIHNKKSPCRVQPFYKFTPKEDYLFFNSKFLRNTMTTFRRCTLFQTLR